MSHLLLIDGSALVHRSYHAAPSLVTSKGLLVGAVHGFSWQLFQLIKGIRHTEGFTHAVVAFDVRRANWRHAIDPGYKASRFTHNQNLSDQFDLCREACAVFGMCPVDAHGFEADDIIATYVDQWEGNECTIVSSDKDLMQLVNDQAYHEVFMLDTLPRPPRLYTVGEVRKRWGVEPEQIPLLLAIAGDTSDFIQGIERVGPVTAAKWINKYGTQEALLDAMSPKDRKTILHNLRLVTLRRDVPSIPDILATKVYDNVERIVAFCDKYEFTRLKAHVMRSWGLPGVQVHDYPMVGVFLMRTVYQVVADHFKVNADLLYRSVLFGGTKISDLKPDDLDMEAVVIDLEDEYGIDLDGWTEMESVWRSGTVDDLAKLVDKARAEQRC